MYESLKLMDQTELNFSQDGLLILNIAIAFIMFGVALKITPESFKSLVVKPKATIVGVVSQFVLLPALTFGLVMLLNAFHLITPGVGLGMLLVASCPGGNVSNFISSFANGNPALSVGLTAFATIGAIFITPLNFAFYGSMFAAKSPLLVPIEINPVEMFKTVVLLLGIPIALGMGFAWKFPKTTAKILKPIQNLSVVFFMGMVVIMFVNNLEHFLNYMIWIVLIVFLHNLLALTTGYSVSSLFKLNKRNRRTISIETGIQNSGLGLVLIFNPAVFPEALDTGGMSIVTAWWGIWHIIAGLVLARIWRNFAYTDEA
ncbi:MAG: bile acid:sodium symporter family protein [Candidatus Delongbacteria bacterium]|jgi:BASS family bile acid:Na+ symporter|nr:bile acid:sodium symporter family protein [Candidatus Delongbacteria bacterium]